MNDLMEDKTIKEQILRKHQELFNVSPKLYRAPGRINLIGEHTDYNEGFVLPAAIDKAMYFSISLNNKQVHRFFSLDFSAYKEFLIEKEKAEATGWALYLLGVIDQFTKSGIVVPGVDVVFGGDIPVGAGLSSSAALECGLAFGLNDLLHLGIKTEKLARMAQLAEHESVGVLCGIMDQYASLFGKKDHVFKLDCRSITHAYFPLNLDHSIVALVDTGVKHELASSEYNQRRLECESGVNLLKKNGHAVSFLRDVTIDMLERHKDELSQTVFKRCRYVVLENKRVEAACSALSDANLAEFGKLMYASHQGLKDEYEVSCNELDILVDATRSMDYVYGARMMGGGFGGCTINLLSAGSEDRFRTAISTHYQNSTGKEASIYFVKIEDGAGRL